MHFIALCICMHIYVCKYMCIYIYITIHAEVNFFNKISHYFSGMSEFASPHPTCNGPRWTSWGSTNPNAKYCTWIKETSTTNTSWEMKKLSASLLKKTWECWWMWFWTTASNVTSQPKKPAVSWAGSKEAWPAGWGEESSPSALHWWGLT